MKKVVRNWRTTLIGIGAGAGISLLQYLQVGHVDWKTWAIGIGVSVLGVLARDAHNDEK